MNVKVYNQQCPTSTNIRSMFLNSYQTSPKSALRYRPELPEDWIALRMPTVPPAITAIKTRTTNNKHHRFENRLHFFFLCSGSTITYLPERLTNAIPTIKNYQFLNVNMDVLPLVLWHMAWNVWMNTLPQRTLRVKPIKHLTGRYKNRYVKAYMYVSTVIFSLGMQNLDECGYAKDIKWKKAICFKLIAQLTRYTYDTYLKLKHI